MSLTTSLPLRSTLMRFTVMTATIGLLLRALFHDPANLPLAVEMLIAAMIYEAVYHLATHVAYGKPPTHTALTG